MSAQIAKLVKEASVREGAVRDEEEGDGTAFSFSTGSAAAKTRMPMTPLRSVGELHVGRELPKTGEPLLSASLICMSNDILCWARKRLWGHAVILWSICTH